MAAAHIVALHKAAIKTGYNVWRVIFDPDLQNGLFKTQYADYLKKHIKFSQKKSWVRHDEHYHVDFLIGCQELSTYSPNWDISGSEPETSKYPYEIAKSTRHLWPLLKSFLHNEAIVTRTEHMPLLSKMIINDPMTTEKSLRLAHRLKLPHLALLLSGLLMGNLGNIVGRSLSEMWRGVAD